MVRRFSRSDFEDRPALGIGLGSTGSRRDTLGVLVMSVVDSSPAARAGLEEGNRIAAINGVNLRVAHEDADDPGVGGAKAERLHREVSQLKVGDNVTLRVYASGQWRDVTMKVVRAGDLPRSRRSMYFGDMMMPPMPAMPAMPSMPAVPPMPPSGRMYRAAPIEFELGPEIWTREHTFAWDGSIYRQCERYYLVRVDEHEPAPTIDLAAEHVHDIRWWTLDELDAVDPEQLAPRSLACRLRDVIERGVPPAPIDVGV